MALKHDPISAVRRPAHDTPLSDVLSVWIDEEVPRAKRVKQASARAQRLLTWWGGMMLDEVTPATCKAYVEARTKGGARRDLEDLKAAIKHHATRGLHTGVVSVELPAKGRPRSRFLTRKEAANLLWVCWRHKRPQVPPRGARKGTRVESVDYHDLRHIARFILMGLYTGSRSAPILRASFHKGDGKAYLDLDAELFYRLPEDEEEAENKKSPVTRLSDRMLAHLRRWRDRGIVSSYVVEWQGRPVLSIKVGWQTAVKEAGLKGRVTPHTLRHTAVTWFMQKRGTTWDAAGLFGMGEQMVREVYGKHHPDYQKEAANRLARK